MYYYFVFILVTDMRPRYRKLSVFSPFFYVIFHSLYNAVSPQAFPPLTIRHALLHTHRAASSLALIEPAAIKLSLTVSQLCLCWRLNIKVL